jgi:hypothetical protein
MPRIRTIKPELPADVKLASVSRDARLTFVYAITQSDDQGLLAGNARQLLGALYPIDDDVTPVMLLGWVEELVGVGLCRWRQTRDGVPVLQITNWSKHQRIDNAGRSQLAALLLESPADRSPIAEARGDSPQVAEARGLDHRPPTEDLGSPTGGSGGAIALTIEANRGLAEHPRHPQSIAPIIATSGKSLEVAEDIAVAGVPIEFAKRTIYDLARSHTSDTPIKSLRYFAAATIRAWCQHREAEAVAATNAPPPLKLAGKPTDTFAALDRWAAESDAKEKKRA